MNDIGRTSVAVIEKYLNVVRYLHYYFPRWKNEKTKRKDG
jgi:hypothetical protein